MCSEKEKPPLERVKVLRFNCVRQGQGQVLVGKMWVNLQQEPHDPDQQHTCNAWHTGPGYLFNIIVVDIVIKLKYNQERTLFLLWLL